ncbi:MAG: DNA repair protein RecN [Myxococcales bacterium]|nr:DNA repair protein RecN [Myxococcales bacterium]
MIETLRIENLAIVENEEIEFSAGLNVLTGETGAGKSIVLGALSLLAGSRASPQVVREGCDKAVVEAVFRTDHLPDLESRLEALGLVADEHELVVQRTVQRGGRSRVRVAGQLIPVAVLAELFSGRIEISSQHDSQSLLRTEFHGRLLDTAAGLLPLRGAVAERYAKLRALDDELAEFRAAEMERERRRDFLSFQVGEINDAQLDAAEIEALRAERSRLAHAERLREEASAVLALLAGDFGGSEISNAADLVDEAIRRLEGIEALDPQLAPLLAGLRVTREELRDTATEIERYGAGIEADPARLAALDERLAQIETLQRKYGGSIEEILRFRSAAVAELERLEGASERAQSIGELRARQVAQLETDAKRLSQGRRKAGRRLGAAVESALRELAMPQARFELALEPAAAPDRAPCGPGGFETPEFRFSAGAGGELLPLRRVASGGELSRTFLAIKSALREADAGMVLVFDEVDAGIGGRSADRVGRCLAELAGRHQVLCITHLPQIAAYASAHFRVEKREVRGRPSARLLRVEGAERVEEIARMAGGAQVRESTRRHARELIRARSAL